MKVIQEDYGFVLSGSLVCDKPLKNNIAVSNISAELSMENEIYRKAEDVHEGIQLILESPKESDGDEQVKREVKAILVCALQEYLRKIS